MKLLSIALVASAMLAVGFAGSQEGGLTTLTNGEVADANQVNANFLLVDNKANTADSKGSAALQRLDTLGGAISASGSNLDTLGSINVAGNVNTSNTVAAGILAATNVRIGPTALHATSSAERLRIVRGGGTANVTAGQVNAPFFNGAGFTFVKQGQGVVNVFYNTPFEGGAPTVTANAIARGEAISCTIMALDGSPYGSNVQAMEGFQIVLFDNDNAPRDWPFNFIAIGPR